MKNKKIRLRQCLCNRHCPAVVMGFGLGVGFGPFSPPEVEHLGEFILQPCAVGDKGRRSFDFGLGVEEHPVAEAHPAVVTLQNVVIDASLTAVLEFLFLGQLGEGYGLIA